MLDRTTFDPQIMGGRACIRGMRIPVSLVVSQVAQGASFEEILRDYPDSDAPGDDLDLARAGAGDDE